MVSKDDIQKLIEATDMAALVSPYVKLIKSGSGYKGLCPFHSEKTPSFSVSQDKHMAKCFGCGKGGNPIQFLMDIKHISFIEAVRELSKINNMELDIAPPNPLEEQYKKYYEINELALNLYTRNLWHTKNGEKALEYLYARGLSKELIEEFKIGLAPSESDTLYQVLKESNFLELDMVDVGLVRSSGDRYFDVFTNRIIFPITDERGKILGFSGRIFNDSDKQTAKYMNTSETPIFKKNNILYNLERAISGIVQNDRIVLHEGFMDVIATYRSGIKEAVCSMGTQLTQNQIKIIKKYTNNVILCYDGDKAGILATYRALDMFEKAGLKVKIVRLVDAKDSDEFVHKFGTDKYVEYFNSHQQEGIAYLYQSLTENLDINDTDKVEEVKKTLFSILKNKQSQSLLEKYIGSLADLLHVSTSSLYLDYDRITGFTNKNVPRKPRTDFDLKVKKIIISRIFELRIFEYAKISKRNALEIDKFLEENDAFYALDSKNQEIWILMINDFYKKNEDYNEQKFIELLEKHNLFDCYYNNALSLKNGSFNKYGDIDLQACLKMLKENAIAKRIGKIVENIKNSQEINSDLKKELLLKSVAERQKFEFVRNKNKKQKNN